MRVSIACRTGRRQGMKRWWTGPAAAWFLVAGTGCGVHSQTQMSDFDEQGQRADNYSVQTTIVGKEKAQLDNARTLARSGDYPGAISLLEPLHTRHDLDAKLRQEILLTLGEMYGAPLNAQRDYAKGRACLEELLKDYPDSEHADRARKLLDAMPH